jgi:hypothetical protein
MDPGTNSGAAASLPSPFTVTNRFDPALYAMDAPTAVRDVNEAY